MVYFNYITNPFNPNKGRISKALSGKQTVWQIVKEQKIDLTRPTVCLVDGVAKLRKDWNERLEHNPTSKIGGKFCCSAAGWRR